MFTVTVMFCWFVRTQRIMGSTGSLTLVRDEMFSCIVLRVKILDDLIKVFRPSFRIFQVQEYIAYGIYFTCVVCYEKSTRSDIKILWYFDYQPDINASEFIQ